MNEKTRNEAEGAAERCFPDHTVSVRWRGEALHITLEGFLGLDEPLSYADLARLSRALGTTEIDVGEPEHVYGYDTECTFDIGGYDEVELRVTWPRGHMPGATGQEEYGPGVYVTRSVQDPSGAWLGQVQVDGVWTTLVEADLVDAALRDVGALVKSTGRRVDLVTTREELDAMTAAVAQRRKAWSEIHANLVARQARSLRLRRLRRSAPNGTGATCAGDSDV